MMKKREDPKEGQLTAKDLLQPHRLYCYYYRVLQVSSEDPSCLVECPQAKNGLSPCFPEGLKSQPVELWLP